MTTEGIFDRAKAMAKIKFDAESASVPSGLNISNAEMKNDEEMEVMRPVDSFFDENKCINISIGTIIEYQGKILGDYCNKFVITEIMDVDPSSKDKDYYLKIYKLSSDGTLDGSCGVFYDGKIIKVLSEEQFVTFGKMAIDKQIENCVENLKLIREEIRRYKKSKNYIKENLQKSIEQYRQKPSS